MVRSGPPILSPQTFPEVCHACVIRDPSSYAARCQRRLLKDTLKPHGNTNIHANDISSKALYDCSA
eukprot:5853940-Amphidinium_carterae.1